MKICKKCGIDKKLEDYRKNNTKKDGLHIYCRLCEKEYRSEYYKLNAVDIIDKETKRYIKNKEDIKIKRKKYYFDNKEDISRKSKEYQNLNKENISISKRRYGKLNRLKINQYFRNKIKNGDLYRLSVNIRSNIRNSFYRSEYGKGSKTVEILGCSFEELKKYLESKFESWMTWDNHGLYNGELNYGWDIDHIVPVSSGETECDVIKLNHYTNLQPLCSKINRDVKKNKIDYTKTTLKI